MSAADYDSWRDDPATERGEGYAIGGYGTRTRLRQKRKWLAPFVHHFRLAAVDFGMIVLAGLAVFLLAEIRNVGTLIAAAAVVVFVLMWFRVRRMEHEKRPR